MSSRDLKKLEVGNIAMKSDAPKTKRLSALRRQLVNGDALDEKCEVDQIEWLIETEIRRWV